MKDSQIARTSGPGRVDPKKLENLAQNWGKLPEKERAQAMQDLTRDMPAKYREVVENYFKKLAASGRAGRSKYNAIVVVLGIGLLSPGW